MSSVKKACIAELRICENNTYIALEIFTITYSTKIAN